MSEENDFPDVELELLIQAIYLKYHYDFRSYSRSSLRRRAAQALLRFQLGSISQLQERVIHDPSFFPQLLNFLTVPTTELFRDPLYFEIVRHQVIPVLRTFPSLKVWIAGCATGEEVYSMAILFEEEGLLDKTIFYATDINTAYLDRARQGIYERETLEKGQKNYVAAGGKGKILDYCEAAAYGAAKFDSRLIRNIVFSDHSLATDSVFAEVQYVSCRNVLIYFNRDLQERAFLLFRDSLPRDGFLGLGTKETLHFSSVRDQFTRISDQERIYRKVSA